MNTSTSTGSQQSAIGKLLDALIKYGTIPNTPVPDLIRDAQEHFISLEITEEQYKSICVNIQEYVHAAGIKGNGGEDIEKMLIRDHAALRAQVAAAEALAQKWQAGGEQYMLVMGACGAELAAALQRKAER